LRAHELAMYMVKVGTANIEKAVNKKISKPDTGLLYS
jgi:hypothetical protein